MRLLASGRRTVRSRLAVLYVCLFLTSSAALLAITYGLTANRLSGLRVTTGPSHAGQGGREYATSPGMDGLRAWRSAALHQLLMQSGIAFATMTVAAIAIGWLITGRTLRPLRVMTTATRLISERNLHERLHLAGPRDEVRDLADTIDGLLGRLDAAFGSQRRFVANASHELRTPLMLTQTLLQVALADPDLTLGSLRTACQEVLVICKEQDRLIAALLTLARSQRGIERREPLDLAELTGQVLRARAEEAAARGVRVTAALGPAPVTGDAGLIGILVANLVENAIRHNVPGGHVRVATADQVLSVCNSGPVLAAASVARLLEPFERGPGLGGPGLGGPGLGGPGPGGLGLGLSIVAAIAAAHNAALAMRPHPAGGLAIEVTFGGRLSVPGLLHVVVLGSAETG